MEDDVEYNHGKLLYRKGKVVEISNFPICFRRYMLFGPFISPQSEQSELYGISFSKTGLLVAVMSLCCVVTLMMVPVVHVVLLGSIIEVECGCRLGSSRSSINIYFLSLSQAVFHGLSFTDVTGS